MSWREGIQAGLPPSPDGESADLRQDIIDELADHLACAMQRERKCTDNDAAAQRAVIERFGNPSRIAYRLWFDAMKETIMNQRISLVTNIVVAMACIAIALVAFNSLKQNTAVTNALMTKLEAIGANTQGLSNSAVWAEATIPVLVGDAPAVGYQVQLRGDMFNPGKNETLRKRTRDDGTAAFGPIRPGKYSAKVESPNGLQYSTRVVLYPGHQELEVVIMPKITTRPTAVSFDLKLPKQVRDRIAYVRLDLQEHLPEIGIHDTSWDWPWTSVLLSADGSVLKQDRIPVGPTRSSRRARNPVRIDPAGLERRSTVELDSSLAYRLREITVYVAAEAQSDRFLQINGPAQRDQRLNRNLQTSYFARSPLFRPAAGSENVWQVEIPDWLVEAIEQQIGNSQGNND